MVYQMRTVIAVEVRAVHEEQRRRLTLEILGLIHGVAKQKPKANE